MNSPIVPPHPPLPIPTATARPISAAPTFPASSLTLTQAVADLAAILAVMFGFILFTWTSGLSHYLETSFPRGGHFIWVVINGLLCLSAIALLLVRRNHGLATLGLARQRPARVLLIALVTVPLCYLAGAVTNLSALLLSGADIEAFIEERGRFLGTIADVPISWIFPVSLFVGVYEEILFRGWILSRLRAMTRSNAAAILLSSLFFGFMHFTQGPVGMAQTAVVGIILSLVVCYSRSLWPAILSHTLVDSLSLFVSVLILPQLQEYLDHAASAT